MDIKALLVSVIVGAALWALALDAFGEWAPQGFIAQRGTTDFFKGAHHE